MRPRCRSARSSQRSVGRHAAGSVPLADVRAGSPVESAGPGGGHLDRGDLAADPHRGRDRSHAAVTATLADLVGQAAAASEKVLVNAPLGSTTNCRRPDSLAGWEYANSAHRGVGAASGTDRPDQHRVATSTRPQRIERVHEPELARGNGSRPKPGQNRCASHEIVISRSTDPPEPRELTTADTSTADRHFFRAK